MDISYDMLLYMFKLQTVFLTFILISLSSYLTCAVVDFFFCIFKKNWHSPFGLKGRKSFDDEKM